MKRYLKYILLALIATFTAASCIEEMQFEQPVPQGDELTLVPRVKSFANEYVTKSEYASKETKITSLAVLVFNSGGDLVYWDEPEDVTAPIKLNKSMLKIEGATIVMFANVSLDDIKNSDGTSIASSPAAVSLSTLDSYTIANSEPVITDMEASGGLPMMGRSDNVDLTPTQTQQAAIEVPLNILYAKVTFTISVAPGTENQGTGSFDLSGFSVYNASTTTNVAAETFATRSSTYITEGATIPTDNLTFYISENRYNHNSDLRGIYPDDGWLTSTPSEDVKNYRSPDDDTKLNGVKYFYDDIIQQYKPKLADKGEGEATYALISGTYTDYRGATWTVNYKVYLGKDNAHNFHVDRNSIYTNNITIKGIRNNDSHDGEGQVWIDHRVNVTGASGAANHVTITRETLIDSHIEVRPLRVSWPENEYVGVRVYLPTNSDGSLVNWIGIERFTGENNQEGTIYCYQGNQSTGKRKYFTTTLISELQSKEGEFGVKEDSGRKYVYLLNGECAWIYFDENNTASQREATINLEFYPASGSTTTEQYIVKQRGLQSIGGYKVESYEEYLHSYDSDDKYNLSTSPADYTQQGLAWGFPKQTISEDIIVSATQLEALGISIQDYVSQRYDYFHKSDIPSGETYYPYINNGSGWVTASYGTGLIFTDRASAKKDVTIKDMGTIPDNAYQYCLSKNKFKEDPDGNHTLDIHWYLPDVYELQAVLDANQSAEDFGADSYYWSSQPAEDGSSITILGYELSIKNEDGDNARAVSKSGKTDLDRSAQHRIRCFYDATGITADMSDRAPDGVGGNYNFYMKAYNGNAHAYFNYMLSGATTTSDNSTTSTTNYGNENLAYPTFDNPGSEFDYFSGVVDQIGNDVQGFGKNPADQNNWSTYSVLGQTYYYTLHNFTGLSVYTMENATFANASRPTTTKKSQVSVKSAKTRRSLNSSLPTASLNTLDHLTNGDMLKISFSNDKNTSHSPVFTFSELVNGSKEVTTTRYWQVPTYAQTTYTPKAESNSGTSVKSAQGRATALRQSTALANAKSAGETAALQAAKDQVESDYPNRNYSYGTPSYTYGTPSYSLAGRRCTITVTCTISFTATATTSPISYYANATGGGWDNGTSVTKTVDGIETDELRMYCGNSFTISLADAYKNDYEITKVKVYFSGDNFVGTSGTLGEDYIYTRFVDANISLPQEKTISKQGSTETLQLPGMDYHDDTEAGTGSHQWTGNGRQSVTLVLADYFISNNIWDNSYTYKYATAATNLSKYIVIDRIEVKCTPTSN